MSNWIAGNRVESIKILFYTVIVVYSYKVYSY